MPRQKTVKRFEQWKLIAANVDGFFKLMEGSTTAPGKRFRDACVESKVPYTLMHAFVLGDAALKSRYDAVLAAKADDMMHESLKIARGVRKTMIPARVAAAKLEVETMHAVASKWDRERYGETLRVERPAEAPSDVGLLGFASELLKLVKRGGDAPAAVMSAAGPEKLIGGGSAAEPERVPDTATALARAAAE